MKRVLTALVGLGFLALAAPAFADCGGMHGQSVSAPASGQDKVVQGEQSAPVSTQTANTEDKSE